MAEVRPLRGLRFNPGLAGDLGTVICPPYDIISPEAQHALYHKSAFNIVRVEHGLSEAADSFWNNKYSRAAETFQGWVARSVLTRDKSPTFYLHHHYFSFNGEVKTRRGLFAAVRAEDWDKRTVRPHEGTAAVFKADRLDLVRAVNANVSPVLALYEDPTMAIASTIATAEEAKPLLRIAAADDESHTLWALTDRKVIETITNAFAGQPLYIADGHHRYETAVAYRKERLAAEPAASSDAAFNFVMMTLVDFSDPGLVVLPFHRLIRHVDGSALNALRQRLEAYFTIDAAPMNCPLSAALLHRILKPLSGERAVIGLLGLEPENLLILRLRDFSALQDLLPAGHSEAYRALDVSILHHVILARLLGVSEGQNISYTRSELEAWQRISAGEYRLGFLLNPVDVYAVKAVADAQDKMPHKSTYFYPKLPTGLVMNSLQGPL